MTGLSEIINAINGLFQTFSKTLGPEWTFLLILLITFVTLGLKIWSKWNDRRDRDEAFREKERTIQRIAAEARNYKIIVFKKIHGWSDEEIDRHIK